MRPDWWSAAGPLAERFPREALTGAVDDWLHHRLDNEPAPLTQARPQYVAHHLARSLAAVALLPELPQRGRLLELGSGLYLMSFLAARLRNLEIEHVQYWGRERGQHRSRLTDARSGRTREIPFREFNAEEDAFPYADGRFDAILNCDTIEHMLCDPVRMLAQCHRVLRPGGVMVVTTPNLLRLDNVVRLLQGHTILDKYVRQSASARHPREYTPDELQQLLEWVGFDVLQADTLDVTRSTVPRSARRLAAAGLWLFDRARRFTGGRPGLRAGRGEQIVMLARRRPGPACQQAPEFLYEAPGLGDALIAALYAEGETPADAERKAA